MTPLERKSLAEQIKANPLFTALLDDMEKSATERLIYDTENTVASQLRVQAIRTFRANLDECLNTRDRRGAPE